MEVPMMDREISAVARIMRGTDEMVSGLLMAPNVAVFAIEVMPAKTPMLMANRTPSRSFLLRDIRLIMVHGSTAKQRSAAPDHAIHFG